VFTLDVFRDLYHGHKPSKEIQVVAEQIVPIRHCVMTIGDRDLSGIEKVYSHPQVWGQCDVWFKQHLPNATKIDASSTAQAVELVKNDPHSAAIASSAAGKLHGVPVVVDNISNTNDNSTRFLVLTKITTAAPYPGKEPSQSYRTLLCFIVEKSLPGSLHRCLGYFANRGVNLTWIMSRPSGVKQWDYVMFIEVVGHRDDPAIMEALSEIQAIAYEFTVIGSFQLVGSH
jgi:prephenate dehydratase